MIDVGWVTWDTATAIAALGLLVATLGLLVNMLQLVHTRNHPTTTLVVESTTKQNGSGNRVTVIVKNTDVQKLEESGAVIRGVWYRIANERRGSIPRFVGPWQLVKDDLQLQHGDVVWFRSVTANVSKRILHKLPLSFHEFPVLKWISPTLRILRRRPTLPMRAASDAESTLGIHGFALEHRNGWHFRGIARVVDYLNPYDQAVLDVVFRVSPALVKSWTFRSLPGNVIAEILDENPRAIAIVTPQSAPKFQGPPETSP